MAAVAACALFGTACYAHAPVPFEAPIAGEIVRAELTAAGTQQAVSSFGPGVREVSGMLLDNDTVSVSILVSNIQSPQGQISVDALALRLQRSHVATVYERKLSVGRTVLFGAGLIVGALALVEGMEFVGRQLEDEDVDGPPPGPSLRIPLSGLWPGR
ncbi:hypothetical protein BH23GEM10_BH23GEM10_02140 [soil metagenome]